MAINTPEVETIVRKALAEDIGTGDITTSLTVSPDSISRAQIVAKEEGVIAGLEIAGMVFRLVKEWAPDYLPDISFEPRVSDGESVQIGSPVVDIVGPTVLILMGERTALNFLQHMSGIATKTARLVALVKHTHARVVDTRKTTPTLRVLEKYAVRAGGGGNHRFGLYDGILIKDNHIRAAGGIMQAVKAARSGAPDGMRVEVEATSLPEVRIALEAGADVILLDNMRLSVMRKAVALCKGLALTEASGSVSEANIARIAETGVDIISVGAITHSFKSLDLSLEIIA